MKLCKNAEGILSTTLLLSFLGRWKEWEKVGTVAVVLGKGDVR